jgi:hypothetical protein
MHSAARVDFSLKNPMELRFTVLICSIFLGFLHLGDASENGAKF